MDWVRATQPVDRKFLVLATDSWGSDDLSEWFPALAGRASLDTSQGLEWVAPATRQAEADAEVQLRACQPAGIDCLETWLVAHGGADAAVYVPADGSAFASGDDPSARFASRSSPRPRSGSCIRVRARSSSRWTRRTPHETPHRPSNDCRHRAPVLSLCTVLRCPYSARSGNSYSRRRSSTSRAGGPSSPSSFPLWLPRCSPETSTCSSRPPSSRVSPGPGPGPRATHEGVARCRPGLVRGPARVAFPRDCPGLDRGDHRGQHRPCARAAAGLGVRADRERPERVIARRVPGWAGHAARRHRGRTRGAGSLDRPPLGRPGRGDARASREQRRRTVGPPRGAAALLGLPA